MPPVWIVWRKPKGAAILTVHFEDIRPSVVENIVKYNKTSCFDKSSSYAKLEHIGENYISEHGYANQPHGVAGGLLEESPLH